MSSSSAWAAPSRRAARLAVVGRADRGQASQAGADPLGEAQLEEQHEALAEERRRPRPGRRRRASAMRPRHMRAMAVRLRVSHLPVDHEALREEVPRVVVGPQHDRDVSEVAEGEALLAAATEPAREREALCVVRPGPLELPAGLQCQAEADVRPDAPHLVAERLVQDEALLDDTGCSPRSRPAPTPVARRRRALPPAGPARVPSSTARA